MMRCYSTNNEHMVMHVVPIVKGLTNKKLKRKVKRKVTSQVLPVSHSEIVFMYCSMVKIDLGLLNCYLQKMEKFIPQNSNSTVDD